MSRLSLLPLSLTLATVVVAPAWSAEVVCHFDSGVVVIPAEVAGIAGDYILDTTVDPTGRLIESDTTNNCGAVRIRLSQMGTPNPQAELLGPGPACGER